MGTMQTKTDIPPKPRSQNYRPELSGLPERPFWRKLVRNLLHWVARLLLKVFARAKVSGLENFPLQGPLLITVNHLGDMDALACLAIFPRRVDYLSKAELYDFPVLGLFQRIYGTIWVHRGQPDRQALRAALNGLAEGRYIALAPEGRESASGSLEFGTGGAAFLALKARVPILPVTFTGTQNEQTYRNLKRLRRSEISVTIGQAYNLEPDPDRKQAIPKATDQIMLRLAAQLPPEYQGVYRDRIDQQTASQL